MSEPTGAANLGMATLARLYETGSWTPEQVFGELLPRIAASPDAIWILRLSRDAVFAQLRNIQDRKAAGESLPLFGLPYAVKDNIDIAGLPTTVACSAFSAVARVSSPVVDRMREAGAILVGKTNLDQLATGLAGDRSPYGVCRNLFDKDYIVGGSSSGSAVAVASGLVSFALGTDTAGSGRVPAGCTNIVGLRPASGLLSTQGVVPACPTLDGVSFLTLTCEESLWLYDIARGKSARPGNWKIVPGTFAVPRDEDLEFFGDDDNAALYRRSLTDLERLGWRRLTIDFRPFRQAASLLYDGPWLAERYAALEETLAKCGDKVLPVTRTILEGGKHYLAVDLFRGQERLRELTATCDQVWRAAAFLAVPTFPTLPRLDQVQADSIGWSRKLGTYTNFLNLLRYGAIAVPGGFTPKGLPGGVTLIGPSGSEETLCRVGQSLQRNHPRMGATAYSLPDPQPELAYPAVAEGEVRVAVAGAHLRGQPLHPDLLKMGARFVRSCRTAAKYRFFAFLRLSPPRPGLLRDEDRAGATEVEIYDLPHAGFGRLVASVAPPLAIGTVELADGEKVKGFLCEWWDTKTARDITDFGGWVAFREREAKTGSGT